MTEEQALKICRIMTTADGGCTHCAFYLLKRFHKEFPGFKPQVDQAWKEAFETEFDHARETFE